MSDYQSYQTYQAPTNQAPSTPSVRIDGDAGMTSRVILNKGTYTTEHVSAGRMTAAEVNPYHGSGTVFDTAKSMHGIGVTEIKADTLITIGGVEAPVSMFEAQGLIHRDSNGQWHEGPASGQAEASADEMPDGDPADSLEMPDAITAEVNRALEGVDDHNLQPLVGTGIAVATGQLDRVALESKFAQFSGASPEESAARVQVGLDAYKAQADAAITSRTGIGGEDLGAFYTWAKASQQGELRGAIESQIHSNNFAGWRALADGYLRANPPSLAAVQAGGYQTRQHGSDPAEVFIDGRWMTIGGAAKLGMI